MKRTFQRSWRRPSIVMADAETAGKTASLWRRAGAFGLDYVLIAAYVGLVIGAGLALRAGAPLVSARLFADPLRGQLIGFAVLTVPVTLYFALSEATAAKAPWGKRLTALKVVTLAGGGMSTGQSVVRSGLKFVPWELSHTAIWQLSAGAPSSQAAATAVLGVAWLLIGANIASALFDTRKRTIYDRLAMTRVIRSVGTH